MLLLKLLYPGRITTINGFSNLFAGHHLIECGLHLLSLNCFLRFLAHLLQWSNLLLEIIDLELQLEDHAFKLLLDNTLSIICCLVPDLLLFSLHQRFVREEFVHKLRLFSFDKTQVFFKF